MVENNPDLHRRTQEQRREAQEKTAREAMLDEREKSLQKRERGLIRLGKPSKRPKHRFDIRDVAKKTLADYKKDADYIENLRKIRREEKIRRYLQTRSGRASTIVGKIFKKAAARKPMRVMRPIQVQAPNDLFFSSIFADFRHPGFNIAGQVEKEVLSNASQGFAKEGDKQAFFVDNFAMQDPSNAAIDREIFFHGATGARKAKGLNDEVNFFSNLLG